VQVAHVASTGNGLERAGCAATSIRPVRARAGDGAPDIAAGFQATVAIATRGFPDARQESAAPPPDVPRSAPWRAFPPWHGVC